MSRSDVLNRCQGGIRICVESAKHFRALWLAREGTGLEDANYRQSEYNRCEAVGIARGMFFCGVITKEQYETLRSAINQEVFCKV